nr:hypothetical protein Q903MT_gene684 [Picea sitchensis]
MRCIFRLLLLGLGSIAMLLMFCFQYISRLLLILRSLLGVLLWGNKENTDTKK